LARIRQWWHLPYYAMMPAHSATGNPANPLDGGPISAQTGGPLAGQADAPADPPAAGASASTGPATATATARGQADLFGRPVRPVAANARQLPLPLGWAQGPGAAPLLMGESNAHAVRHAQRFADWGVPASILIGPAQSGRSTLARLYAQASGGVVVDGLAMADEVAVFHAWNNAQQNGNTMLIIADSMADIHAITLPDLKTRLATAPVVMIDAPDACLTRDLVEHQLRVRGLNPAPQLGAYVAARIERSYSAIHRAVAAIDALALNSGRAPGIRMARTAMIDAGLYHPDAGDGGHDATGVGDANGAGDAA
ncbi:MAG: hypothetical protein ACKOUM_04285, partial [Sphingopyxis sp.]